MPRLMLQAGPTLRAIIRKDSRVELLIPFLIILLIFALSGIRVAQEYQRSIVFRIGRFQAIRGPGFYWNIPCSSGSG